MPFEYPETYYPNKIYLVVVATAQCQWARPPATSPMQFADLCPARLQV
jgi:hypothetical protein